MRHARVPEEAFALPPALFKLYSALWLHASPRDGLCWPKVSTLAALLGVGDEAVRKSLRSLRAEGWVQDVPADGRVFLRVVVPAQPEVVLQQPEVVSAQPEVEVGHNVRLCSTQPEVVSGALMPILRTDQEQTIEQDAETSLSWEDVGRGKVDGRSKRATQKDRRIHQAVFDAFNAGAKTKLRTLDAKRRSRIVAALADHEPSQLVKAAWAISKDRWWRGEEPTGSYRNGRPPPPAKAFDFVIRTENVELWAAQYDAPKPRRRLAESEARAREREPHTDTGWSAGTAADLLDDETAKIILRSLGPGRARARQLEAHVNILDLAPDHTEDDEG